MTKTDRTTNAEVRFVPEKSAYSELEFSKNNSSFAMEHCYQKILKGSNSLNENTYNNSEASVNDHLKDKHSEEREDNNIYGNVSTDITGNISGYDTQANGNYKNQEEEATYYHLH